MEGGELGHHCHSNTVCVNTVGSYRCDCPEGYEQVDKFGCAEVDECAVGRHRCHENAECTNTDGSYRCRCRHGYTGDGYDCQRIPAPSSLLMDHGYRPVLDKTPSNEHALTLRKKEPMVDLVVRRF
ncbi:unnamed protein product [Acanthoscelides obtectus]|uniref:EGF-like domain-containing protein n=1 Tax=Acanthoscelides obtectus TaxID=200917 RepID=A0A9P0JN08_ACAOB|nr:unnamed protein product [Acanthoscelides obtectus]CAK1661536.1 Protein kinase C-binding protein NELL1 [Acanthoscelides obtectus]